jgi:VanZ family protein
MKKQRVLLSLPAIAVASGIFIVSSIPQSALPPLQFDFIDKMIHFVVFFIFGLSLIVAFYPERQNQPLFKSVILIMLIGLLYSAMDEFHQFFVPGRSCDIFDWIADSVGVATSLIFRRLIWNMLKSKIIL